MILETLKSDCALSIYFIFVSKWRLAWESPAPRLKRRGGAPGAR